MKLKTISPFEAGKVYLLDGGFSTQLSKYVSDVDTDPLWTARSLVQNKKEVIKVHRDFISAGARIILTCSYQVSNKLFQEQLGLDKHQTREHVIDSVKLAWQAIQLEAGVRGYQFVAGSVGPYGACLHDGSEYTGDYLQGEDGLSQEELVDWHRDRIQALQDGGVSFIAAETVPMVREALAIMDTVCQVGLLKMWVTFTLKDKNHLAGGETVQEAVTAVVNHQLSRDGRLIAVGFNCSSPDLITEALQEARLSSRNVPLIVYPNSGEKWECGHWSRVQEDDVSWLNKIQDWIKLGTIIIGGCCRVDAQMLPKIEEEIIKGISVNF